MKLSLRDIQLAELKILDYFDEICREQGLRYSLAGGSLLGAVRHKGFIPWDDDIDVCMPRADYEAFVKTFQERAHVRYELYANNVTPFVKLLDKSIQVSSPHEETKYLWMDIFPVDGLPDSYEKSLRHYKKALRYIKMICWPGLKNYSGSHSVFLAALIHFYIKIFTKARAAKHLISLAQKYSFDSSKFIGCVVWGLYGIGERMLKSEFEKFVDVEFEGHTFKAMSCWDSYLTGIYGDYMQLPPEEKRITHGFKAYRIEEEHE